MRIFTIAFREIKLGMRNSWTYSFLILLTIFILAVLLLQSGVPSTGEYTDITGAMMNITLYLLPLITLLLGGISTVNEKEDGHWNLLTTYNLSPYHFLVGKWLGLAVILLAILSFSFGFAGLLTTLFGNSLSIHTLVFFWGFSTILAMIYLGISISIGAFSKNRWQSLMVGIGVWFFTIILWPLLLISILSFLPYPWIKPILEISTFLNPAEFVRIFSMMHMGAGSVFGPEYNHWVTWVESSFGLSIFAILIFIWIGVTITIGAVVWERMSRNG
ncbi:ABC transporter permease [Oceanobacillus halophilus]|uniref:ABC transporter permease n=1 Tax=Oceanobacillus halophilus TaxID=930130 RepID=A0A495A157_9BACI|nr:ABC transporter permease subunit [Oceanobacillus halophilus]RKQ33193.1 ABC transporter permease [Oceanobacillus halophilus]